MGKMADRITSSQARSREPRRELFPKETGDGLMPHGIGKCTELWIMQPMDSLRVTIMSRQDCHLCRVVTRVAKHVQQDLPFHLSVVDVDSDPELKERYGDRVPVVLLNDQETLSGKVTGEALREAIKKARWRNPISRILSRVKLALTRG